MSGQDMREAAQRGTVDPDFWRGRRVLVTGHTGFKGAWLVLWLKSMDARVTGLAAGTPTSPSLYELVRAGEGVTEIAGDVRDAELVRRVIAENEPEVVIHMAAQPLVRRSLREPRETYETNVLGTVNVLDAVRTHGAAVRAVVNVTSDKCYEPHDPPHPHREQDPMGGSDPYSSSKGCAELVTAAYRRSFFSGSSDVRLASARAGNVIGGGDWGADRLVPDLIRAALAGEELQVRNPAAVRPWQHVLNPLSGYLVLAQSLWSSPEHAAGWNFGPADESARPVSWIVERIAALWPGGVAWRTDDRAHPAETPTLTLDSSHARSQLGWRPPLDLDAAVEATVAWHLARRDGDDMRLFTLAQIGALTSAAPR